MAERAKRARSSRRVTLFHNPSSGDAETTARQLQTILREAGYQVRYQSTKKDWSRALSRPGDAAVVAGGDGTVAQLLRSFADTGIPVAILPFGTANNIGKALGIFGDVHGLVSGWDLSTTMPFDVGVVSGPFGERRFVESVGGGLFAELIRRGEQEVEGSSLIVGRETDRALQLLRALIGEAQSGDWQIELDGHDLSGRYLAVEAMNIGFAGPNVPLATEAELADGQFELVLLRDDDRDRLAAYVTERVERGSAIMPSLDVRRGRHVRLTMPPAWPLRIDDELIELPGPADRDGHIATIDILVRPRAIRVVASTADRPGGETRGDSSS